MKIPCTFGFHGCCLQKYNNFDDTFNDARNSISSKLSIFSVVVYNRKNYQLNLKRHERIVIKLNDYCIFRKYLRNEKVNITYGFCKMGNYNLVHPNKIYTNKFIFFINEMWFSKIISRLGKILYIEYGNLAKYFPRYYRKFYLNNSKFIYIQNFNWLLVHAKYNRRFSPHNTYSICGSTL